MLIHFGTNDGYVNFNPPCCSHSVVLPLSIKSKKKKKKHRCVNKEVKSVFRYEYIESLIFAVFFLVCDRLLGENRVLLLYNSDKQLYMRGNPKRSRSTGSYFK